MTAPNAQLNDETMTETDNEADHIDSSPEGSNIEAQNPTPQPPTIDFAALYRESLVERRRQEEELERLRNERNAPQTPQHQEITDEYFEKHGTAKGVATIVESVLERKLRETLGDVSELSQDFKRGKQLAAAEEKFYQAYPQLAGYREQLAPNIRSVLANAPSIDPRTYEQATLSAIGLLTINNLNAAPPQPQTQPSNTPNVPSTPAPRGGVQIRKPVRKLTEFERTAMRQAGFDPNKADSIEEFFRIVEGDEGVTV